MNIQQIRGDTPLHEIYSYFDTAAASAPPRQVIEEMTDYLKKTSSLGTYLPSFRREVYEKVDIIREQTANFLGAKVSEIAFTKNGTEGINFIANGIKWNEGDEVILADFEFHSNFVPWLKLQQEGKIKLRVLKTDKSGVISLEELRKLISSRTRLITVTHLPNASGALQPIKEICDLAQKYNIHTLINVSQTIGLVPIDVKELKVDFLAACGRKYLRGPEGSGILYVREELMESIDPSFIGWGGTLWNFETNDFSYPLTSKKFEAGCLVIPSVLGLGAAIEYAHTIGIQNIYERVKELTIYTVQQLADIQGLSIYGPKHIQDRLSIVPFNVEGLPADQITEYLEENHIIIESGSFMANTLLQGYGITKMARFSVHYFNTHEEIDRAVNCIKKLVKKAI